MKFLNLVTKLILFLISLYSVTPYVRNVNQLNYIHLYSNMEWLYFTHISLYLSLFTVTVGFIHRFYKNLFPLYNTLIPIAMSFEFIVTFTFWILYAIDPALILNKFSLIPGNENPFIQELGQHLFPLVLLVVDQVGIDVKSTWFLFPLQILLLLVWLLVIKMVGDVKGKFIYPWMNKPMPPLQKMLLGIGFALAVYCSNSVYFALKEKSTKSTTQVNINKS